MTEQDILFWLEDNYFTNPDAGIEIYYREDVIEKLLEMQKSIAELEKYNLDLANESHAKSERIAELEAQRLGLTKTLVELEQEYAHLRKVICQKCQNIGKQSGASS